MIRILVSLIAISLAGCSTSPTFHHWYKPNIANDPQAFNADWYACVRENENDAMAIQCMKARGYQLAWSDDSDKPGLPQEARK